MPANSEVSEPRGDESILPIASELSEPDGGKAWIAIGVCALAFSVFASIKMQSISTGTAPALRGGASMEARVHDEAAQAASPAWAAPEPAPTAAPVVKDDVDVDKVLEQALPLVNGAAQAEPAAEQDAPAPAPQVVPAPGVTPAPAAQNAKFARRAAKRAELWRRGHEFTLALNLGIGAGQETATAAESPATVTPTASAEASEPPVIAVPEKPKSPIPDNPY